VAPARADDGFTLVEVLVSIGLIGVVMAAVTSFLVSSMSVTAVQRGRQAAAQLAADATEQARTLRGPAVLTRRDQTSVQQQWSAPVTGVAYYLATMQAAWDATATYPDGATAPLPTGPSTSTLNNVSYQRSWYVGRCWQTLGGGDCVATGGASAVPLLRIVVAVTWPERHCAGGTCSFVSSTLISDGSDEPVFNLNQTATSPAVSPPASRTGEVGLAADVTVIATGGTAPLTWSASGLPGGLTMSSSGRITGTLTTAGNFTVIARVVDGFGLTSTGTFTWAVAPPPAVTTPGTQTTVIGDPVSLPLVATNGTAPYTWSVTAPGSWGATGLPPGLTLNPATGYITGTTTQAGAAKSVTVTVTDTVGQANSATFTWTVLPRPTITVPTTAGRSDAAGSAVSLQAVATGGTAPYTWSASSLPAGLAISSSGLISGTITRGTRYLTTITVRDSLGATQSTTMPWTVTASSGLRVTAPTGDRTGDRVGQPASMALSAAGASGTLTWTVTGLPTGLTRSGNSISGTPTAAGTYVVTLTARDSSSATATYMFTWTVQ
jgi:prepilin-type N-terminal cleavage/methylation domain-containing protein